MHGRDLCMILPSQLVPTAFGLDWGMSQEECLQRLAIPPVAKSHLYAAVELIVNAEPTEVIFCFASGNGLSSIEVCIHRSQSFWDSIRPSDEEERRIHAHFQAQYAKLVADYTTELGSPTFAGTNKEPGFPQGEIATWIAYWDLPTTRFQVKYDHQDRELPILIWVASSQLDNRQIR